LTLTKNLLILISLDDALFIASPDFSKYRLVYSEMVQFCLQGLDSKTASTDFEEELIS
jgi:hypothetical protein